jgi:hypothetical protein
MKLDVKKFPALSAVLADASPEMERAKEADLVTLPEQVTGTNCANCKWVEGNFCKNPKVNQDLKDSAPRMCCALWDAEGTKRAWEKPERSPWDMSPIDREKYLEKKAPF